MPAFLPLTEVGSLGLSPWNGPHCIENAGQANSYSRNQLTGMIANAAQRKSRYLRFTLQLSYHFRAPNTIYSGNLVDWFFYTCFSYGVIPAPILHGCPDTGSASWNALLPADGRFRHANKPEVEHQSAILDCNDQVLDILASEADRVACPRSLVPVLNGNEKGKGGGGDWRPYEDQNPVNPEEGSAEGVVPSRVVSFTGAQLDRIRLYDFIAVSPAIEAQSIAIMQQEVNTSGWKSVLTAHDKVAIHCYPEIGGTVLNRGYAAYAQGEAYKARKAVLDAASIDLPIWVTECGWVQSNTLPIGSSVPDLMATVCKRLGAEEAFPFVLVMDGVSYAVYAKTDLTATAPTWPGTYAVQGGGSE